MRALFEVGEEVIVESVTVHGANATILDMGDAPWGCDTCHKTPVIRYALDIQSKAGTDPVLGDKVWCQCALRKKYNPGDSFESIMKKLKNPIKQPVMIEK